MRSALVAVVCVCGFLLGTAQTRSNGPLSYDNEAEYSNPPQSLLRQAPQVGWEGAEPNEYEESPVLSEEKNWPTAESNAYAPWEIIAQRLGKLRIRRSSANERESSAGRPFSRSGGMGGGGGGDRPMLSILNPLDVLRQRLLLEMARRRSTNQINQNKQLMQNVGRRRRSVSIEGRRSNADGSLKRRENNSSHRSGPATNVVRSSPGFQVNPPPTQIPIKQ